MVKSNSRRVVQAEQTRAEILRAAREQFVANGYAATSLKGIAAQAGVSVQTLYDSVGSKADLVRRLSDLIDEEAQVGEIARELGAATDPVIVAAFPATITCRIVERCGDLVRIGLDGARTDAGLAPVVEEGGRRHREGARRVAARLAALDALAPGLDVEAAAISIATLSDVRVAFVLIDDHGLDLDAARAWMAETTAGAVLG